MPTDVPQPYTDEERKKAVEPFKILKPRNSGRVQACFAENDALRAERQLLFATIDQLKQENAKLKEAAKHSYERDYFNTAHILATASDVLQERDRYKQALEEIVAFYTMDGYCVLGEEPIDECAASTSARCARGTAYRALHPEPPTT